MNTNMLFDFSVNKENKTIHVKRQFDADLRLVWDAWTQAELLDQWWAPKPYRTKTKSMDFREGGSWLYAMISPADEKFWCRADYKKIETLKSFSAQDGFCDEEGIINPQMPRSFWTNAFSELGETTVVNITIVHEQLSDLEKIIEMGFKEGFTMGLGNLDDLLVTLKK